MRRLVCFPHAGGDPSFFQRRAPMLASRGTEILALDLEQPADAQPQEMTAVLAEVRRAVGQVTDLPYVIFGHSLGALLAWETVCRLQEDGARLPAHLFLSSFSAPHRAEVGLKTLLLLRQDSSRSPRAVEIEARSSSEARLGIWPRVLPSWQRIERQPLCLPLTVFQGQLDYMPPEEGVEAWSGYTSSAFTAQIVPGGHFHVADRNSPVPGMIRAALERPGRPPGHRREGRERHDTHLSLRWIGWRPLDGEKWLSQLRDGLNRRPGVRPAPGTITPCPISPGLAPGGPGPASVPGSSRAPGGGRGRGRPGRAVPQRSPGLPPQCRPHRGEYPPPLEWFRNCRIREVRPSDPPTP